MRQLLAGAVAAALLAVAAPAQAHPTYHFTGDECGSATVSDGGTDSSTTWQGTLWSAVVATAGDVPAPTVPVSVECRLYRNGVDQGIVLAASGTGAVVSVTSLTFQAAPHDLVDICSYVTVGGDLHVGDCGGHSDPGPFFPPPVYDVVDAVDDAVDDLLYAGDPLLCAAVGARAPDVPGVVDITPEGDVHAAGEFLWDCPPYA